MSCERCAARPAKLKYTELRDGRSRVLWICEECARELGFGSAPEEGDPESAEPGSGAARGGDVPSRDPARDRPAASKGPRGGDAPPEDDDPDDDDDVDDDDDIAFDDPEDEDEEDDDLEAADDPAGDADPPVGPPSALHKLVLGALGVTGGLAGAGAEALPGDEYAAVRCEGCGITGAELRDRTLLGCPRCYETFERPLDDLLLRLHGALDHAGRLPGGARATPPDPEELHRQLKEAIENEDFEAAARLRDRLRRVRGRPE